MRGLSGIVFALVAALAAGAAHAERELIDRIVAVANDEAILASELQDRLKRVRERLAGQQTSQPPPSVLARQVLERMVTERLQLQVAERAGVRVDEETLNATLHRVAEENGVSLSEFRRVLARDGVDFEAFREDLREQITLSRLHQRQVESQVTVTEREIQELLASRDVGDQSAEYRLGHILISVPEGAAPDVIQDARERAESVLERVRGGADFAQTAVAVSDGQQALEGGDLGWRSRGEVPSIFADRVDGLTPGELAGPIRSPSGFHIVKLMERRGGERHVVTQARVRHILARPGEGTSDDEARRQLDQLRWRVRSGDSFEELARSHSDDTRTAPDGGDLGWTNPGELPTPVTRALEELEPGEISPPVKSQAGWHLVQLVERRRHDATDDYRRARAQQIIRQRKAEQELEVWLRQLRDGAYIDYRLEPPDAA